MTGRRWRRPHADAEEKLARAQRSLEEARALRREQARKREQEQEGVIAQMERLAEGNHLAALVWDVVIGNGGQ